MLKDLDHPAARGEPVYDIAYENVQAGLRTDYLFRLANKEGGFVVGTGDLSELALGWCTYGVGDQMSHYNVNAGAPKTLIQHLIHWVAVSGKIYDERKLLHAVLQPRSPRARAQCSDEMSKSSKQSSGPTRSRISISDLTRYGFRPRKIAFLAYHAWSNIERGVWPTDVPVTRRRAYDLSEIRHWLALFLNDFSPISSNGRHCQMDRKSLLAVRFRHVAIGELHQMQI